MNKNIVWAVLGFLLLLTAYSGCSTFNRLSKMDEAVTAKWHQVENVYQRRADLIPNLVNTVQGYADFEKSTLTAVVEARAKATSVHMDAEHLDEESLKKFQEAQAGLGSSLSRLLVVAEQYPELKANQNFLSLQAELEGTENRIANERRMFNDAAQEFNSSARLFPANIWAGLFHFSRRAYFESAEGADKAPTVKFNAR